MVVPKWGITLDTVRIAEKLRDDGDLVHQGDAICSVETDKAMAEIEATATGILAWVVDVDDEVAVGGLIAHIAEGS